MLLRNKMINLSCGLKNKLILNVLILSYQNYLQYFINHHLSVCRTCAVGVTRACSVIWNILCTTAFLVNVNKGSMLLSTAHLLKILCKVCEDLHAY